MASVLSRRTITPPQAARPASQLGRRLRRGAFFLVLVAPLLGLAVWAHHEGFTDAGLLQLKHRAGLARAGGSDLSGLRYAYPPVPVLLALVLPNAYALTIVTCVFSAATLWYIGRSLLRRVAPITTAILLVSFVAVPAMWFMASQLLAPVISLIFLVIALDAFIRFAAYGQTEGGFVAGLALVASACADPVAILFGIVMCVMAPLISHSRYHDDLAATASITAVLFFPIVAFIAGWSFLVWKFSGSFAGLTHYALGARPFAFPRGVLPGLGRAAATVALDTLRTPLYLVAGIVLFPRRAAAAAGLLLPVIALIAALWLGFAYSDVTVYFLFTLLALTVIAHGPQRKAQVTLAAAAIAQLCVAICWPPTAPFFHSWLHIVLH